MDWFSTLFLGLDGVTNGAVYALVGLSLVLVYTTTRVVNVAQGEFLTFGALSFASFIEGSLTPLLYVVLGTGAVCLLLDAMQAVRFRRSPLKLVIRYAMCGALLTALAYAACHTTSIALQMFAALMLVASMGPLIYRLTVEPNPGNPPVVLLICSVGVSLILHPLALLLWGADPKTVPPLSDLRFNLAGADLAMQSVIKIGRAHV